MTARHCRHVWTAGMMYVHDEDLPGVAAARTVTCERCDLTLGPHTPEPAIRQLIADSEALLLAELDTDR